MRYKSKMGIVYEITGTESESVLSVVHTDQRVVRNKTITTERKQSYLRADRESCLAYLMEIDIFEEIK